MFTITTFQGLVNWANECQQEILTCWSVISTPAQDDRIKKLYKQTTEHSFFECGGEFFKGDRRIVFIKYMLAEPEAADFYIWCQNNLKRYTPAK